jgi:DNA transposition AAA+ family ATPase
MHELSIPLVKGSVSKRVIEIIRVLADDPRPIILDEADHLVKKSLVDVIREISDPTHAPIIMIGEVHLPTKLQEFDLAHNRVLEWTLAEACALDDARELAKLYAGGLAIADDLLRKIVVDTDGCTRRVVTNIDRVRVFCLRQGIERINAAGYAEAIYKGLPPPRAARAAGGRS